jgi:hypothetical protein
MPNYNILYYLVHVIASYPLKPRRPFFNVPLACPPANFQPIQRSRSLLRREGAGHARQRNRNPVELLYPGRRSFVVRFPHSCQKNTVWTEAALQSNPVQSSPVQFSPAPVQSTVLSVLYLNMA